MGTDCSSTRPPLHAGAAMLTQAPPSAPRTVSRKAKRIKLRAREHARLQCENLELDIMNLRQEIATLTNLRQLLYERTLNRPDSANGLGRFERIVREYYALTADGFYDVVWRKQKHGATAEPVDVVQFMRSCFDESLAIGDRAVAPAPNGLEVYFGWMYEMMAVVESPKVRILHAQICPGDTKHQVAVVFQTRCASVLTPLLLDSLYPHLKSSSVWLREKLIGKNLATIADGTFVFDKRSGLVVRVDLRIDQAASILKLAESMEELQILKQVPSRIAAVEVTEEANSIHDGTANGSGTKKSHEVSPMSLRHVLLMDVGEGEEHRASMA